MWGTPLGKKYGGALEAEGGLWSTACRTVNMLFYSCKEENTANYHQSGEVGPSLVKLPDNSSAVIDASYMGLRDPKLGCAGMPDPRRLKSYICVILNR